MKFTNELILGLSSSKLTSIEAWYFDFNVSWAIPCANRTQPTTTTSKLQPYLVHWRPYKVTKSTNTCKEMNATIVGLGSPTAEIEAWYFYFNISWRYSKCEQNGEPITHQQSFDHNLFTGAAIIHGRPTRSTWQEKNEQNCRLGSPITNANRILPSWMTISVFRLLFALQRE